jgi:hypothetical protein
MTFGPDQLHPAASGGAHRHETVLCFSKGGLSVVDPAERENPADALQRARKHVVISGRSEETRHHAKLLGLIQQAEIAASPLRSSSRRRQYGHRYHILRLLVGGHGIRESAFA